MSINELLYADDTLLFDVDRTCVAQYMRSVETAGSMYGLGFNWKKLGIISVGADCHIPTNSGTPIKQKTSMVYLGCVLREDGTSGSELSRRLGSAREEFQKLQRSGAMPPFPDSENWMCTTLVLYAS